MHDRWSALSQGDSTGDISFYAILDRELDGHMWEVRDDLAAHEEAGRHLMLENRRWVIEATERAAEDLAASRGAIEAQSPSSDIYQDCLETTPTSPRNEKSQ